MPASRFGNYTKKMNLEIERFSKIPLEAFAVPTLVVSGLLLLGAWIGTWDLVQRPIHAPQLDRFLSSVKDKESKVRGDQVEISLGHLLWKARMNKKLQTEN